ncbi:ISL1 [Lepeophtheirus salmonis]|uniref:ISL1 n=1 Tax=Lepeophtheirus salmonis TaxID=72036 RepID=A0A7R8D506_LEPSM|nr:ISL1 [Lepeophtheirus salmonis]CAF3030373.1 ISL1 [Lepeophtheirus salmonis]
MTLVAESLVLPNICSGRNMNGTSSSGYSLCVGCGTQIHDQYILRVAPNLEWHAACLKCNECQMFLDEKCTCFVRDGKTFCKKDYVRLFGTKCEKCCRSFGKNDYVMRAKNKIFHLECFRCVACEKQLVPGDEFALRQDELFCKEDHRESLVESKVNTMHNNNNNNNIHSKDLLLDSSAILLHHHANLHHHNTSNSSEDNSEAHLDFSDEDMSIVDSQEDVLSGVSSLGGGGGLGSISFGSKKGSSSALSKKNADRKSARARTEQLVEMTALSPRVIRVWFQNKRCKDKKIQNRLLEKQMQRESDGRKLGYGNMHGIPMVATSPVRHDSPVGMNPVEISSYEPPWKALSDFALNTDLDRLHPNNPHFQHLVNQMHGNFVPEGGPPPPGGESGPVLDTSPYHPPIHHPHHPSLLHQGPPPPLDPSNNDHFVPSSEFSSSSAVPPPPGGISPHSSRVDSPLSEPPNNVVTSSSSGGSNNNDPQPSSNAPSLPPGSN